MSASDNSRVLLEVSTTNGFSLARKVLLTEFRVTEYVEALGCTVGEELLKVHTSYLTVIQAALAAFPINGIAHITGGGLIGNTKRLLTDNQSVKIDWNAWKIPPVFNLIKKIGDVPDEDMRRTFNLGIGLVFIVGKQWADPLQAYLREKNYQSYRIGEIV